MSCAFFDAAAGRHCGKVTMLGSFFCADHARARRSSVDYCMKLPPVIPDDALPKSNSRPPTEHEKSRFAQAAAAAFAEVTALTSALDAQENSPVRQKAEASIEKIFGAQHAKDAVETLKNMAWVLDRWAKKPEEGLTISETKAFLGWAAGTSEHGTGLLGFGWTAAPISLPRVTEKGINDLSTTLIHESAHGVSGDIQDACGYRHMNPGKFYKATVRQRLTNADHYAQCVAMFKGRLTEETWDEERRAYSADDGDGGGVASKLRTVFIDLATICLHAKIAGDRLVQEFAGRGNDPIGNQAAAFGKLLGGNNYDHTTTRRVALARVADIVHQIRRLEDAMRGVDYGDGNVVDLEDLFKEMEIAQKGSAAIVFPVNVSDVKVTVVASKGTPDRDLRGLLLKEMVSECLQSHNPGDAGRGITAEVLYGLHARYAKGAGISPIDVNLKPTIAKAVGD